MMPLQNTQQASSPPSQGKVRSPFGEFPDLQSYLQRQDAYAQQHLKNQREYNLALREGRPATKVPTMQAWQQAGENIKSGVYQGNPFATGNVDGILSMFDQYGMQVPDGFRDRLIKNLGQQSAPPALMPPAPAPQKVLDIPKFVNPATGLPYGANAPSLAPPAAGMPSPAPGAGQQPLDTSYRPTGAQVPMYPDPGPGLVPYVMNAGTRSARTVYVSPQDAKSLQAQDDERLQASVQKWQELVGQGLSGPAQPSPPPVAGANDFIFAPPGSAVTQAFQFYINPQTGQKASFSTGGQSPRAGTGWRKVGRAEFDASPGIDLTSNIDAESRLPDGADPEAPPPPGLMPSGPSLPPAGGRRIAGPEFPQSLLDTPAPAPAPSPPPPKTPSQWDYPLRPGMTRGPNGEQVMGLEAQIEAVRRMQQQTGLTPMAFMPGSRQLVEWTPELAMQGAKVSSWRPAPQNTPQDPFATWTPEQRRDMAEAFRKPVPATPKVKAGQAQPIPERTQGTPLQRPAPPANPRSRQADRQSQALMNRGLALLRSGGRG
jgi:hypothetical protein